MLKKTFNGHGGWSGKSANGPKEGEKTSWSKLRRMGMMGGWMETRTQLGIGVKLISCSPLGACWEG
jgi:hypothetical protein